MHIQSLDKAFQNFLYTRSLTLSWALDAQNQKRKFDNNQKDAIAKLPQNPIAKHKDFSSKEFSANLHKLMSQFAKSFIRNFTSEGLSETWAKTIADMGTKQSISVNNISFSDLRIITTNMKPYEGSLDWPSELRGQYANIAKSEELSPFLREVFGEVL